MLADNTCDFTLTRNGYTYETSLSTGFHFLECPQCHSKILFFVIPPIKDSELNPVVGLEIADDPRFPSYLSTRCPDCHSEIFFDTGDQCDNPFLEDEMLIDSIEDWRE